jgi:predicted nucleotidyltransferase
MPPHATRTTDRLSHLTAPEREAVDRYVQVLGERLGPRLARAILFGSRARGEGHEESDLDVAVVVRGPEREVYRQVYDSAAEMNMEYDYGVRLAPLLLSEETLEDLRDRELAIARAILEEGVPL